MFGLSVGSSVESVCFPKPNKLEKSRLSVANAVLGYRKRWNKGFKGATRTVTGGVRFWCIQREETDGD